MLRTGTGCKISLSPDGYPTGTVLLRGNNAQEVERVERRIWDWMRQTVGADTDNTHESHMTTPSRKTANVASPSFRRSMNMSVSGSFTGL